MAPSSSSTSPQGKYDVFLSFRGSDNRYKFTSHLYAALCRKGILTFADNNLKRGDEISPSLLKAIEESKLSVIIFSENYASSKWCLDELAKIIECKELHQQLVLPVFYNVDPSYVRNQEGSFADAFAEHEKLLNKTKVQTWRAALKEAGNLSGWDSSVNRLESKFIEDIVEDIFKKLNQMSSTHSGGLIGIDSCVKKIESLLCMDSPDIRIIGIWGMGGIGKTTISEAVFDRIYTQFDGFHFFANVKEELKRHSAVDLRNRLFTKILNEESLNMDTLNLRLTFVKERLRRKKVLIVFDDLDDSIQLEELLDRQHDLFGPGTKILITSRNRQVLKNVVDEIHEVEGLKPDEALQLFSVNAFKMSYPTSDYIEPSKRVINYAEGNPLALKVLGSALFDKSREDWNSALDNLEKIPKRRILNLLRLSYDELSGEEQNIFLDIACFFKGENRKYATVILDSCYFGVHFIISNLIDKSLVTVSKYNMLKMHDLLKEMGWAIVREESITKPRKRSRLYDPDDIYHVLMKDKGTNAIHSIFLDVSKSREIHLESNAFVGMNYLKFLKIYGGNDKLHLPRHGLQFLPNELRYLYWENYPSKSLPSNFCAENLVALNLPDSKVKRLWRGVQHVANLKQIDLSGSKYLTKIPDLSRAQKIESINLSHCKSLVKLHPSVQYLKNLECLNLRDCENLMRLPSSIDSKFLRVLNLSNCPNVQECPEIFGNLERLCLDGTAIKELPQSTPKLKALDEFVLSGCSNMTKPPEICWNVEELWLNETAIEEVPTSIGFLTRLCELEMSNCKMLSTLPSSIFKLKSLSELDLSFCQKLESLPEILEYVEGLKALDLSGCKNFKHLPSGICKLKSLNRLDLSNCSKFKSFPEIMEPMESLTYLHLSGTAITELPPSIKHLICLEWLYLNECKNLVNIPRDLCKLKSLNLLDLSKCSTFKSFPEIMEPMESLECLYLNGTAIKELPSSIKHLISLEKLDLDACKNLVNLPSFKQLSRLLCLTVNHCTSLCSLPELPPSLRDLEAKHCESLETLSSSSGSKFWRVNFANCFKLDQKACSKFLSDTIQFRRTSHLVHLLFPGSEIPQWFCDQNTGSSVTIRLPSNGNQIMGIAFCIVFALGPPSRPVKLWPKQFIECPPTINFKCECRVQPEAEQDDVIEKWDCAVSDLNLAESDQLLLWNDSHTFKSKEWFIKYSGNEVSFEFYQDIKSNPLEEYKVKKCGVLMRFDEKPSENPHRSLDDFCNNAAEPSSGNGRTDHEGEEPNRKRLKMSNSILGQGI